MELHTERLLLRPYTKQDVSAVQSYAGNPLNVKYVLFGPNTLKETKQFIRNTIITNADKPRRNYDFLIEKKDDKKAIGGCGLYLQGKEEAELGWILHIDYWNNNYTTEAAEALICFGFVSLKLHRIYARCNGVNIGSWRVMEKCHMQKEAVFRQARRLRSDPEGAWYDEYQYAILDADFTTLYPSEVISGFMRLNELPEDVSD